MTSSTFCIRNTDEEMGGNGFRKACLNAGAVMLTDKVMTDTVIGVRVKSRAG